MAQIDADERDYVSLAALRDGNGRPEAPRWTLAIVQYGLRANWPGRLAGDARFGKVTALS
jgi:hypothetical protein